MRSSRFSRTSAAFVHGRREGKVREARIRSVGGRTTEVSWKGVTRRVELRTGGSVTLRKF